jgi:hypothetical protein
MSDETLKRYTSIPSLLHILRNRKITLLDPSRWDDSNDSYSLSVYKERMNLRTLLAICFTEAAETYHHWHVFAGDTSGICITFNKEALLECFDRSAGFDYGPVDYRTLEKLRRQRPRENELPFIKRAGFLDECEFRVLYKNHSREMSSKEVRIPLNTIERITLSPWIPRALVGCLRETISSIDGCDHLGEYVVRSTLIGNSEWKELVSEAT